jgi:pyrrolysyl-tRNA synthetase-like protein
MRYTMSQIERLRVLGCAFDADREFDGADERNGVFAKLEQAAIKESRAALRRMREDGVPVLVNAVSSDISAYLRDAGFIEVSTPIIISKKFLERMTIDDDHSLHDQVFWLDGKSCLRPMLAPGLYDISKRLLNIHDEPLGVFEIGPCFRRESQGNRHLECFTMVNFVEWGTDLDERQSRLESLASGMLDHLGITGYAFEEEQSTVYGLTTDVVLGELELGSSSMGPHPLDDAWGITTSWIGFGMGIERLTCVKYGISSVQRVGRSTSFLNGVSLTFK